MTPPIQEPSSARDQSGSSWAIRQLARRPALGSCPCPIQSAIAYDAVIDGTSSVSDNTLTTINWDNTFVSAGATALSVNTPSPTTSVAMNLLLDGWFIFWLDFEWSGAGFTDDRLYQLVMNTTADNDSASMSLTDGIGSEGNSPYQAAHHHTYGPLYFRNSPTVKMSVKQNSGAPQDITGVLLTAIYMGPDMDPGAFPPF